MFFRVLRDLLSQFRFRKPRNVWVRNDAAAWVGNHRGFGFEEDEERRQTRSVKRQN
jgi:hypothetical protein